MNTRSYPIWTIFQRLWWLCQVSIFLSPFFLHCIVAQSQESLFLFWGLGLGGLQGTLQPYDSMILLISLLINLTSSNLEKSKTCCHQELAKWWYGLGQLLICINFIYSQFLASFIRSTSCFQGVNNLARLWTFITNFLYCWLKLQGQLEAMRFQKFLYGKILWERSPSLTYY